MTPSSQGLLPGSSDSPGTGTPVDVPWSRVTPGNSTQLHLPYVTCFPVKLSVLFFSVRLERPFWARPECLVSVAELRKVISYVMPVCVVLSLWFLKLSDLC